MSANLRSALLVAAAVCLLTVNDALAKHLVAILPFGQIMALRGLVVVSLLVVATTLAGQRPRPVEMRQPLVLARGGLEAATAVLSFAALLHLPLATATAILYSSPLFATALAALVLRERVTGLRWAVLALGFIGVVLVTDPLQGEAGWAVLLPLGGALAMALADLVNRRIDPAIGTGSIVVATTGIVTLTGLGLALGGVRPLAPVDAASLVGMGVALAAGYACLIAGFRQGEISFSVPFRYVSIPFAMLLGWVVWGDVPTMRTALGAALIVAGGVLLVAIDRRRAR